MYCPRCGRQVNNNANFCGGCGLSKKEIDEQLSKTNTYNYTEPVFEKAPPRTGEVEKFTEQPFPTDVEFRDVPDDSIVEASVQEITEENPPVAESQFQPSQEQFQRSQEQYQSAQSQYQPSQEQNQPSQENVSQKNKRNEPLSTVDFVWMILLSLIPGVNIIYLFYQAFVQNNNINRRSYARAVFIVAIFAILIGIMFFFGFLLANLIY